MLVAEVVKTFERKDETLDEFRYIIQRNTIRLAVLAIAETE